MDISVYQDLTSGTSIVALQAVVDEIRAGNTYIVKNEGKEYQVLLDDDDELILNENDRPEGGYPPTGGPNPPSRNAMQ
jgi:hypothetical protein